MKHCILFLNGDPPQAATLKKLNASDALIVCTDGAYNYLRGIVTPDVILGDFDSISPGLTLPDAVKTVRFPADKDFTDGHLAMQYLIDIGVKKVTVYGGFGGRADHAYANLSLLYLGKTAGVSVTMRDETQSVELRSGNILLLGVAGRTISLEPFFERVHIIQTKGLRYNLRGYDLTRVHALGVSNVAVADTVTIEAEGELLVFQIND